MAKRKPPVEHTGDDESVFVDEKDIPKMTKEQWEAQKQQEEPDPVEDEKLTELKDKADTVTIEYESEGRFSIPARVNWYNWIYKQLHNLTLSNQEDRLEAIVISLEELKAGDDEFEIQNMAGEELFETLIAIKQKFQGPLHTHRDVVIQTENGAIGVGPAPDPGCEDRDRANAGNQPITLIPGGSYFDSATSFAMIRGGHVDATFLGTLQVDEKGNIANWIVPGKMLAGMGGAMDLITGAKIVYIVSEHCSKDGASKLMKAVHVPAHRRRRGRRDHHRARPVPPLPGQGLGAGRGRRGYTLDDIAACTDMAYAVADDVKLDAFGA